MPKTPMTAEQVLTRIRTIIEYYGHTLDCDIPVVGFIGMAVLYETVDPLPPQQGAYFMNMLVRGLQMLMQKERAILS